MRLKRKILCAVLCMCMVCTLAGVAGIQANADTVPADFSFNVNLADSSTYRCYEGSDTAAFSSSNWKTGSGSYNGGIITATNSGSSSTIQLRESGNFRNAEYILVPFTMSVTVPAYTAYAVDTRIQLSMNRNAKGSTWYVFEWTGNKDNAAYSKSFSTKMDLTTTEGFVYRAYGNDKSYTPTEKGTLVFDNRTGTEAKTITQQYAIFAGNSKSGSLLKSYHHKLETSLTLTPTSLTATKVITYYIDGQYYGKQQSSDNSITIPNSKPSKTGYVFTGWLGSDDKTYQPGDTYNGNTGLTLTAQWSEGKSTVTFNANDGAVSPASKEVCVDSTYGELPTPTRDYYTFLGWYTDKTGGSKVTSTTTVTKTSNHTLYAHWMNKTAYVKLDPNGGSPSSSGTVNAGTKLGDFIGNSKDPTRTDYTFAGWYTDKTGGTQVDKDTVISDSVTYYAHWTGTPSTITLNYGDGRTNGSMSVNYGGTYSGLTDPTRTNYTFDGWYTAATGGSKVTSSTTVTAKANHTLYARWTRNTANIRFMDGADTIASRTVNTGDKLGTLPTPAKTGYEFNGWYTAASGGTQVNSNTIAEDSTNYYARWTAKTYTVTFDKNDGTTGGSNFDEKNLEYGRNYTLPDNPERTGYTFKGWYTAASGGTKVTKDTVMTRAEAHTLYAQWERIVYTVTFKNGSTAVETRKVNAGEELGTLPAVTKIGYTFKGWYTGENNGNKVESTATISGNVTYYAQWTANQYTITFNPNGGTVTDGTKTLTYGAALGTLPTPTRTGYTFNGWYTAVTGGSKVTESTKFSTAADTTYYAHWKANEYKVTFDANDGTLNGSNSATVVYGSTYGTLPTAIMAGYNFVGWYTQASGGTQVTSTTVMTRTGNHTLYAHWETQHQHAVAPGGTAVDFGTALTQSYINDLTSKSASIGAVPFNYITLPAGNYYLTEDITTSYSIWLTGNVNLCFNGHTITSTFDRTNNNIGALMPYGSCQFAACDCQGGGGFTCAGQYVINTGQGTKGNCTVALYGGTFSGENTMYVNDGRTLIVDGATVRATSVAINAQTGANITIKSGLVTSDNSARDYNVATVYVYSNVTCKIEGGTITNTNGNYGYAISAGSQSSIQLSGSPVIKGTAGDFSISGSNAKIEVAEDLAGVYTVSLGGTVSKRSAWTMTTESNRDVTSHFVGKNSNIVLQDVVGDNSKHAVQLYTPHKHSNVEWNYAILNAKTDLTAGGQYVLTDNLTRDLTIPEGVTVDLCLNGKTLTGKITVNGTLNLYSCKNGSGITNNDGSVIVVGETGTLNYYGGKLTGGKGDYVPIYADGIVNLYATPTISTECDYEIRGNSPGFLHICAELKKPTKALRVNFGTADSVKIADKKQVVVTSGWSAYMSGKTMAEYFAPRANRIAKIDTNEDGELILRLLRVTIDGVTYYPAYNGGQITSLPATPTKTGYIWDGYYTAESGGEKKDISTSTVFEDNMTLYSQWKECDHSGNKGSKETTAATCTTAGSEKYTCSECGLAVENVIDALGHDYSRETWTKDETRGTHYHACTREGCNARVDEAEHTWNEGTTSAATCTDDGSVKYKCTACSATKTETIPALGHEYSDQWLNDETNHWHKCSREGCNETTTPAAHTWGAWVVTKAAEVNVKGEETSTCEICGKTKTREIEALTPPEPTKYTVTYQLDEYTVGDVPTQVATAKGAAFALNDGSGLTRTGYTFAGWALLDEKGEAGNNTLTGGFTMPERDVTFVIRWTRVASYDLKSGETIVLEDNSVVKRSNDGKTVTIDQGGNGSADTTITLTDGSGTVTVINDGNKDEIVVPAGSAVRTGDTTVNIGDGGGSVEITGAVNAPAGSSVTDGNGNEITMNSGTNGRIDTDGTVSFSGGGGSVTVTDKNKNTTNINVPAGSEGVTVTENGTPLVDNGSGGVTIVSADGTTTTITLPEDANENASIDEIAGGVTVPAGSTITTVKDGTTTTTTIKEGTGNVDPNGTVTLPNGGKVVTEDSDGNKTESTVGEGETVTPHTHNWSDEWNKDNAHHWHDCNADNCPVKVDSEKNGYTTHTYNKEVVGENYLETAATCTAKAVYYKSCECGAKGTDTFKTDSALGHSMTQHEAVAATCTTEGNVKYWSCSNCGKNFSDEAGTAELTKIVTDQNANNHSGQLGDWQSDSNGHWQEYSCCHAKIHEGDHTFGEWSGSKRTCIICDYENTCEHSWDDGNITTAPKCETAGVRTYTCTTCRATKTEKIAATGHKSTDVEKEEATCTKEGHEAGTKCSECGKALSGLETIQMKEHDYRLTGADPATCEKAGTAYYKCNDCEATKTETIDALNHSWSEDFRTDIEATCTKAGSKSKHCTRNGCSAKSEVTEIAALGHNYGEATYTWSKDNRQCTAERQCTRSGCSHTDSQTVTTAVTEVTQGQSCVNDELSTYMATFNKPFETQTKPDVKTKDKLGHDYTVQEHNETQHWNKCSRCDAIGEQVNHFGGTATCKEKATCTGCNEEYGDFAGHEYGDLISEVPATHMNNGTKAHYTCSVCEKNFDEDKKELADLTIEKLAGHTYGEWTVTEGKEATCTAAGEETRSCICGEKETREIKAKGHKITETKANAATCIEAGNSAYYTCSVCDKYFSDPDGKKEIEKGSWIIEAKGHTEVTDARVEPTCTETGLTEGKHCSVCKKVIVKQETIDATGHSYGNWIIDKEATEDEEGSKHRECNVCKYQEAQIIPELEHTHTLTKVAAVEPACTRAGNSAYYTCSGCGKYFSDAECRTEIAKESWIIEAKGHTEVTDARVEPTCTETGLTEGKHCSVCKKVIVKQETIDATGHSYGDWIIDKAATEDEEGSKHRECSVCDDREEGTVPKLTHTHEYKSVVKEEYRVSAATCTSPAVYYKSCECGETGTETFEDGSALDHSYEWQHDADKHWKRCIRCNATDEEGDHVYDDDSDTVCSTCGYERTVAPVGHTHTLIKVVFTPAACISEGVKEHWECSDCDKWFSDDAGQTEITDKSTIKVPAAGHKWDAGTVTTAPTTSSEGVRTYTCTVCSDTKTETVAKISIPSGGSSGGSTGTDNVVNKAENKTAGTAATTTATVKPSAATTTADGKKTAATTVDDTTADKIIDKAVSNRSTEVVVNTSTREVLTEAAAGAVTEIALPEKTVQELSQKTEASVTIRSDAAKVTLNKEAVDGLAAQAGDDGYVRLVVEIVKQEPKRMEVELKLVTSKGTVTDFRGGDVSVTVRLNDTLAAAGLVCVYIDDYGTYHKVTGDKNADGTYNFVTGHFSRYAIMALDDADKIIAEQTAKVKELAGKIQLKARSVKTAKGNIKVRLKITKGADSFKALEDMGYTLKYQFYRSTEMRKNYRYKFETYGKPYTNTDAKKGTRYYYKARIVVYDTEGNMVLKTDLKKCWYATRIK